MGSLENFLLKTFSRCALSSNLRENPLFWQVTINETRVFSSSWMRMVLELWLDLLNLSLIRKIFVVLGAPYTLASLFFEIPFFTALTALSVSASVYFFHWKMNLSKFSALSEKVQLLTPVIHNYWHNVKYCLGTLHKSGFRRFQLNLNFYVQTMYFTRFFKLTFQLLTLPMSIIV